MDNGASEMHPTAMPLYRRSLIAGLVSLVALSPFLASADAPRVSYDKQCFTLDGHDTLIYSAAFHYFRCPKPLWRDRFKKLKEAGFNTVETYAAWNWHERTPPANVDDYSKIDMTDLDDWLKMAEDEFGFYTIVRPGPYICAEWDGGGYPQWLTLKKPADYKGMWFRSDDPEYLKWCSHWYTAVAKTVVPHLLTHKSPGGRGVIFWQLENEYNYAGKPPKEMLGQLLALGHLSKDLGIDVPMFTSVTHNETLKSDPWLAANVFDTDNIYPGFGLADLPKRLEYLPLYQPDKPKMITELQGGWFATLGNKLSDQQGHTAAQIQQLTMLMWQLGFTSTNYYMGFGGTNLGDWAASSLMTSYDYNAPVREAGGVTDRYLAVKGMGAFIAAEGGRLTRTDELPIDVIENTDPAVLVAARQAKDGTRFVFVHTADRDGPHQGTIRFIPKGATSDAKPTAIHYDLAPFGAKVCVLPANENDDAQGRWYPEPAAAPQRPGKLPDRIEIATVKRKYDSLPDASQFQSCPSGKSVEDFGIFDRRTTIYRAGVDLKSIAAGGSKPVVNLTLHDCDNASVIVDGHRAPQIASNDGEAGYRIDNAKTDGPSDVVIVYENGGRPNGGGGMERRNGLSRVAIENASTVGMSLREWRSHDLAGVTLDAFIKPDIDDHTWPLSREGSNQAEGTTVVYRAGFDLADADVKLDHELKIGRIDDSGSVYVNGELVGKSISWSEPFRADITKQLKAGHNVIAVVVHNEQGEGGLSRGVSVTPIKHDDALARKIDWQFAPGTRGMQSGWSKADLDDSSWETVKLDARAIDADANAPLAWYRATFTLPANDPHAWVPWKARLDITGNAFLYLNGQPLGRYWNAGPQKDFYLPECWLKPGQPNVITMEVRGLDKPEVRSITVIPYADQAEAR